MRHNSTDNTGDRWTEDIISVLQEKGVTRSFKNQLASSGMGVYIQVRLLFQQQTGHLHYLFMALNQLLSQQGNQQPLKQEPAPKELG